MGDYKLHSKGDNWFHFRKKLDSICESFTITFIHDGTVVMSGDYGTLAWRREFHPKSNDIDYGFPGHDTDIGYFAEKVVQWGCPQKIKEWKAKKARDEIEEYFDDNEESYDSEKVKDFLADLRFDWEEGELGMAHMLEQLNNFDCDGDWTDGHIFGDGYSEAFIFRYEVLKSVSKQIIEEVRKKGDE